MVKQTAFRAGTIAMVLTMGACTWFQQPAAPVVSGTGASVESGSTDAASSTNPYGATPYTPGAGETTAPVPYTPPPAAAGGAYIPSYAPVDVNAATHTVVRGDTVYNISKRYNVSQDNLRVWNNLADNNIGVGQVLRVKPSGYTAPAAAPVAATPVTTTPAPAAPAITVTTEPAVSTGSTRTVSGITWQRPTAGGSVITNFGGASKGVDISGTAGQAVVSAADGKVVYAGSGLRGYGNLVIVQHNATFLTAYGHNQALLVKEGQTVKRAKPLPEWVIPMPTAPSCILKCGLTVRLSIRCRI